MSLLYVPLLLRAIGDGEYGLYQMIGSIIACLSVVNATLSAGATRYYCKYYALGDETGMANVLGTLRRVYRISYVIIFIASLVLALVVRVAYAPSFTASELAEAPLMIMVLGLNLMIGLDNTLSIAVITAHEDFVFLKGTQTAIAVLQVPFILLCVHYEPFALTVCIAQTLANLVLRTMQHVYARKRLGMDLQLRHRDHALERELLVFSSGIVLGSIADQVFWKTDQLILGYMSGTETVAVYAVGMLIATTFMNLGTAMASVYMPRASELWNKDHDVSVMSDLFRQVSRIATIPVMLILTGFTVFGRDFIRLWAGENYGEAWVVAMIVMVPFSIDILQNTGLIILQVMDKYGFRAKMYVVAALFNLVLTMLLTSRFGSIGAASSTAIAIVLSSGLVLNWYYDRRVGMDMRRFWLSLFRELVPIALLCAAAFFVWDMWVGRVGWLELVLGIAVYTVLFCVVTYLLSLNEDERALVKVFLQRA